MDINQLDFLDILKQKEEQKIENTPIQQLLPLVFDENRVIPNAFIRSALFGLVKKGSRANVENEEIFSMSQYQIFYSGNRLDQSDLLTWDSVIYLAKLSNADTALYSSMYKLLQKIGLTNTGINAKAVMSRLSRLQTGQIKIIHKKPNGRKSLYAGSLIDDFTIDEVTGNLAIRFNKRLLGIFGDGDYTFINGDTRQLLGQSQLARWLFHFYSSHDNPIPFKVDFIQALCNSDMRLSDFRYRLKETFIPLYHAGINLTINEDDYVILVKSK
jgi:hypothetical protein